MSTFCKKCGNALDDNDKFCKKCGSRVSDPVQQKQHEAQESRPTVQQDITYNQPTMQPTTAQENQSAVQQNHSDLNCPGFGTRLALVISLIVGAIPTVIIPVMEIFALIAVLNENKNYKKGDAAGYIKTRTTGNIFLILGYVVLIIVLIVFILHSGIVR